MDLCGTEGAEWGDRSAGEDVRVRVWLNLAGLGWETGECRVTCGGGGWDGT